MKGKKLLPIIISVWAEFHNTPYSRKFKIILFSDELLIKSHQEGSTPKWKVFPNGTKVLEFCKPAPMFDPCQEEADQHSESSCGDTKKLFRRYTGILIV